MKYNYIYAVNSWLSESNVESSFLILANNNILRSFPIYRNYKNVPFLVNIKSKIKEVCDNKLILLENNDVIQCNHAGGFDNHAVSCSNTKAYSDTILKNVKKIVDELILFNDGTIKTIVPKSFTLDDTFSDKYYYRYNNMTNVKNIFKNYILLDNGDLLKYKYDSQYNLSTNKVYSNKKIKEVFEKFIILDDGRILTFDNSGNVIYTNIENVKDFGYNDYHTFLIFNDGTIMVCGLNYHGELGLGDTQPRDTFTKVPGIKNVAKVVIPKNSYSVYLLLEDNTLMVCGDNEKGQLGLGDTKDRNTFTKVNINGVKDICCCYSHESSTKLYIFILLEDGTVLSAGNNYAGEYSSDITSFTKVDIEKQSKTVLLDNKDIDNINNYSYNKLQTSKSHTLYLKDANTIMVCGNNQFGQLGLGNNIDKNVLTKVPNISDVKQVSVGDEHSMILFNDGTIATCGNNQFGQLGLGNNENKNVFTKVPGITNVEQISCGGNSSTIKLTNSDIMSCGNNSRGQLCLGDNINKNVFTKVDI